MRFLAALLLCLIGFSTPADARRSDLSHEFSGDRYSGWSEAAAPQKYVTKKGRKAYRAVKREVAHFASHIGLGPKPRASCGWYMRGQYGGKYGADFNRAYAWARLPRSSLQPGAVVVTSRKGRGCGGPCGHVVKVVSVIDQCRAIVQDNRGTYERNTCRNRVAVVMP